ncbi:MAG: DNA cytosine methyltransferase [Caldilineaceae bacterium]
MLSSNVDEGYKFIDLFCGAGGLSQGFINAGFKCVQAIDHDESAIETHKSNFCDNASALEISEAIDLEEADVIIGGPPCQGFSSAGMRRTGDTRNTLVRIFAELIVQQKPKAFVFENVEGFLTADNGNRVFDLLEPLIDAGYRIHLRKINAANYGVPQHRKRVLAIGGLGWEPTFPQSQFMAYGAPGASNTSRHLPLCPTLSDALAGLPEPQQYPPATPSGHFVRDVSQLDLERIQLLKPGQTMKNLPQNLWHDSYKRRANRRVKDGTPSERRGGAPAGLRRLIFDQPSKAVTSGAISEFVHPISDRFLTLRECARIQTFPDDFCFAGTLNQVIVQIGNAVPPLLARAIADNLVKDLQNCEVSNTYSRGALLSFIPTTSTGMSPALRKLSERVYDQYLNQNIQMEQLSLWP